jgi:hypothetical protein
MANQSISSVFPGHSLPNLLFVTQHDGFNGSPITTYGRPLQILFSTPMTDVKMLFGLSNSDELTMVAYSPEGTQLDSVREQGVVIVPSNTRVGTIELQEPSGIGHVELYSRFGTGPITANAENFGIDDLDLTPVPEPSTLALLTLAVLPFLAFSKRLARS